MASATWNGRDVVVEAADPAVRAQLVRAFRPTPVVTDDASLRRMGTSGDVVIQPADLEWFRAVALVRAVAETQLHPRFVPGVTEGGFDPAANYRPFHEQIERLTVPSVKDP